MTERDEANRGETNEVLAVLLCMPRFASTPMRWNARPGRFSDFFARTWDQLTASSLRIEDLKSFSITLFSTCLSKLSLTLRHFKYDLWRVYSGNGLTHLGYETDLPSCSA